MLGHIIDELRIWLDEKHLHPDSSDLMCSENNFPSSDVVEYAKEKGITILLEGEFNETRT